MALYLSKKERLNTKTQAFLYKWTHIPTGKWYVGSRTAIGCHPDDGYICSSNDVEPMIKQSRQEWSREILVIGDPLYIRELEFKYLMSINAAKDEMSFNKTNADGKFHRVNTHHTDKTKCLLRVLCSGWHHTDETKKHFSNIRKGSDNPFYQKHHSEETKEHFRKLYTGKKQTSEQIEAKRKRQTGVPRTDNAKSSISKGILALQKIKCIHCAGEYSPALHGRWHGDKCKSRNK